MPGEEKTISELYDEILKNRDEIKNFIAAYEARVLLKIEEVNNTVVALQNENLQLKEEVEFLRRSLNKKNIIIHGLNKGREEITAEIVSENINSLLGVNLSPLDISDVYPLGKTENCPIKVEFISNLKKKTVLQNCG